MTLLFFNQILNEKFARYFFSSVPRNSSKIRNFAMFVVYDIRISLLWRSTLKIWIFMKNFAHRTALSKKLKSVFLITLTMFRFVLDGFDISFFSLSSSTLPRFNQRRQMMRVFQRAKTERWWHKNFYFIRFVELQSLTSEFRYDSERVRWTVEWMVIKSSQPGWSNIYTVEFYDGIAVEASLCVLTQPIQISNEF